MLKPEINLFQHPTTTVYIDDSTAFLYSITLGVDHQPHRAFSDPFAGLDYLNQFNRVYDASHFPTNESSDSKHQRLGPFFGQLANYKLHDEKRYAEPSVVVVDYSMPQLNGLDLCSRLTNPYIKKVLLTGVADEKVAIKALNTEVIDFYINKSEPALSEELFRIIAHLRDRYFQQIHGWTLDSRLHGNLAYLYNADFADYFEDVCEQLDIVEHYPLEQPWGLVIISRTGEKYLFLVEEGKAASANNSIVQPATITINEPSISLTCSVQATNIFEDIPHFRSFKQYLDTITVTSPNNQTEMTKPR